MCVRSSPSRSLPLLNSQCVYIHMPLGIECIGIAIITIMFISISPSSNLMEITSINIFGISVLPFILQLVAFLIAFNDAEVLKKIDIKGK